MKLAKTLTSIIDEWLMMMINFIDDIHLNSKYIELFCTCECFFFVICYQNHYKYFYIVEFYKTHVPCKIFLSNHTQHFYFPIYSSLYSVFSFVLKTSFYDFLRLSKITLMTWSNFFFLRGFFLHLALVFDSGTRDLVQR